MELTVKTDLPDYLDDLASEETWEREDHLALLETPDLLVSYLYNITITISLQGLQAR